MGAEMYRLIRIAVPTTGESDREPTRCARGGSEALERYCRVGAQPLAYEKGKVLYGVKTGGTNRHANAKTLQIVKTRVRPSHEVYIVREEC